MMKTECHFWHTLLSPTNNDILTLANMFPILLRPRDFTENYMKVTEQFMFSLKHLAHCQQN